jgi:hypothetical protein
MEDKIFYCTICYANLRLEKMTEKFKNQIEKINDSINKGQRQI